MFGGVECGDKWCEGGAEQVGQGTGRHHEPGVDLYRSAEVADQFSEGVRSLVAHGKAEGKPVAITEFGCTAYRGAGDRGARAMEIVEFDKNTGRPVRLDGE